MTTKTKWGDKVRRREDILRAARDVLEREGLAQLTIRDVAKGAGVSPGSVYTYFGSREELFVTLYVERLDRFHTEIAPACANATTPEELFTEIARRFMDVYRVFGRELNFWSMLVSADDYPPEIVKPLIASVEILMLTVQEAIDRFERELHVAKLPESSLVLPLTWTLLVGLADHFAGQRHLLHPYASDELVTFAARTLVTGLTQLSAEES